MKSFLPLLLLAVIFACQSNDNQEPIIIDQQLIYISSRGNGFDVYKSDQDGSNEIQLTTQPGFDWGPRWWEARKGIIHYSQDTSGNFAHQLITTEGKPVNFDFQELSDFIASPDGRYALYTEKVNEKDHIFLQDLSTQQATDITPFDAYHGRPLWSPDSQWISYISDSSGSSELHLYHLIDQSHVKLTEGAGRAKYHSWSPNGDRIAFTREVLEEPKKDHDIYLIDIKTQEVTQFTNSEVGEQEISWSPLGDKIAYHGTVDGKDDIYTINLKTKTVLKITKGRGYHGEPSWIPVYKKAEE